MGSGQALHQHPSPRKGVSRRRYTAQVLKKRDDAPAARPPARHETIRTLGNASLERIKSQALSRQTPPTAAEPDTPDLTCDRAPGVKPAGLLSPLGGGGAGARWRARTKVRAETGPRDGG
ncbi:hypothetical protein NCCP1664_17940 [Zafaria cholistanensis]|uniref:Uncharacterized protein n=1 Tax=Zafaria cholistanensis TaxID=1682741 RepID=A0A5A7NU06_9MICC|nr:hypothetical protein NCCP1664_17940 [Zafaria cholistanensis]